MNIISDARINELRRELLAAVEHEPLVVAVRPALERKSPAEVVTFCREFPTLRLSLEPLLGAAAVERLRAIVDRFLRETNSLGAAAT